MASTLLINGECEKLLKKAMKDAGWRERKEKATKFQGNVKVSLEILMNRKKVFHTEKVTFNDKNRRLYVDRQKFECLEIEIWNLVFESDKICKTGIL